MNIQPANLPTLYAAPSISYCQTSSKASIFQEIIEDLFTINNDDHQIPQFNCLGHKLFFHRYSDRERAKQKASEHIDEVYSQNRHIKEVHYELIKRDSEEGKESGLFRGLNSIYKYAIFIHFQHKNNSLACPFHPLNKS